MIRPETLGPRAGVGRPPPTVASEGPPRPPRPDRAAVVVVGAGPTGVTAAALLARQGVDCLVLDRWPDVFPQPRAVHLDDEVHRLLGRLGLSAEFAAISRPARGLRLLDAHHEVLAEFARSGDDGVQGHPQASMFDQPDLERLLRALLGREPHARFRGNVEVTGIIPHELAGDGGVTVELMNRLTGEPDAVVADYVLGCDGAQSLVRRAVGARMSDLGFAQRWLVVDLATRVDLGQWEGVHQVCSPKRAGTYMRIGDTRYRFEFQLHDHESAADLGALAALLPLLRPWIGGVPDDELDVVRVADYTFRAQVADRWRAGPIFLLGDAAHLTPPFVGQGMGAGLRDADNLAWKLAGVLRGELPASDLDSYERERRPHAAAMIRRAVAIGRVMTGGGRAGDLLRRTLLPGLHSLARRLPGVRRRILDSATPPLRASTLVHSHTVRRRLGGQLCPDAPVDARTRLDDRIRGRFVLVTDRPVNAGTAAFAERAGVVLVPVDPDDALGQWLAAGRAHAALVRPDATVLCGVDTATRALAPLRRSGRTWSSPVPSPAVALPGGPLPRSRAATAPAATSWSGRGLWRARSSRRARVR